MASLIEELTATLEEEYNIYKDLIPVEERKVRVIIKNDLRALQEITEYEQDLVQKVTDLEHKRQEVVRNIGIVMSKDPATLDLKNVIKMLEKQPEEQKRLSILRDNLHTVLHRLQELNFQNQSLIEQSLDIIEFNMNFIQSTRMSPGNNNYTRNAAEAHVPMDTRGMFDAKR